ncbi:MAG: hypothetical protein JXA71_16210 [Chitinispirillaceae bacterium]|nr:hypothetical protein [Chitinispirillaceae bacterium]
MRFSPLHKHIITGVLAAGCFFQLYPQQWRTTGGPEGGDVSALVVHNNAMYAGTNSGIWKSPDEGTSWQYVGLPVQITNMCSIGQHLFAVTWSDGVWQSTDGGTNWDPVTIPIDLDRRVNMIDAALGLIFAGSAGGSRTLFVSYDSGAAWSDMNIQDGFPKIAFLSSLESVGSCLFMSGESYGGIIRSKDTGKTWERVNEGLINKDIRVLGSVDSVLLAGSVERSDDEGCIFVSHDNGGSWINSQNGLPTACLKHVNAFGSCGNRVFAAVHEFTVPSYVSERNYIYKSDDYGATWQRLETGLPVTDGNCFLSCADRLMLAPKCGGVFSITENDSVWIQATNGLRCMPVSALCATSGKLYCSAFFHFIFEYNSQHEWQRFPIALHHNACMDASDTVIAVSGWNGLQISKDNGSTWIMTDTMGIEAGFKGAVPSVRGKPVLVHQGFVFCAKWDGIFRTRISDYGTEHVFVNTRNTVSGGDWYFLTGRKQTMLAGFAGHLFISNDIGATWEQRTDICNYPTAACFPCPENDSIILIAEYFQGVYRSNNGGMTWSPPITVMPMINTFASWKGILFAGIKGLGTQISYDTGATWAEFNNGMPVVRFITSLLVIDTLIYAGTDGSSVWVLNLNELAASVKRKGKRVNEQQATSPKWKLVLPSDNWSKRQINAPGFRYDLKGRRLSNTMPANQVLCAPAANKVR